MDVLTEGQSQHLLEARRILWQVKEELRSEACREGKQTDGFSLGLAHRALEDAEQAIFNAGNTIHHHLGCEASGQFAGNPSRDEVVA